MDSLRAIKANEGDAAPVLKRYGSFEELESRPSSRQAFGRVGDSRNESRRRSRSRSTDSNGEDAATDNLVSQRSASMSRNWTRSNEVLTLTPRTRRDKRRPSFSVFEADPPSHTNYNHSPIDVDISQATKGRPYGVLKIEAISQRIGRKSIRNIFICIYFCTFITSLEANVTPLVEPYLMSVFNGHSLMPTVAIVSNLAFAIGRPPFARLLDVFGRAESLVLAISLYSAGFLLEACSNSVATFTCAKVLASLGGQGLQLATQILIADTTSMTDRGIYTASLALPWMATIWIGPLIGQIYLLAGTLGYRAVYATFAFAVPALTLPLVLQLSAQYRRSQNTMTISSRKARQSFSHHTTHTATRTISTSTGSIHIIEPQSFWTLLKITHKELDILGMALCTGAGVFLLLPLSLAATWPEAWVDGAVLMLFDVFGSLFKVRLYLCLSIGVICAYAFATNEQTVTTPFLPSRLLANRTIKAGCLLGFFHFTCQLLYESYFSSFLQVARYTSPSVAQYTNQSYIFSACISALFGGWAARKWQRYKMLGIGGVVIHMVGAVLMVRFRKLTNPLWEIVGSQVIAGIGGGLTTISMQLGVQAVVSHADVAMATAVLLTITQFGAAVGGALAGAVWTSLLPRQLRQNLPEEMHDKIKDIMGSLVVAMSYERGTPERIAIDAAYVDTQWLLNLLALFALVPAFFCILAMEDVKFDETITSDDTVLILGDATPVPSDDEGE